MESKKSQIYTPLSLLEEINIDKILFKCSKGGITFGGGEPAIQSRFISLFREICDPEWTIFLETSLNVHHSHIVELADCVSHWYIDIKDMNNRIYQAYTGCSNNRVIENLKFLVNKGLTSRITVRVPNIPGFNNHSDVDSSISLLNIMGLTNIEPFNYYSPLDLVNAEGCPCL